MLQRQEKKVVRSFLMGLIPIALLATGACTSKEPTPESGEKVRAATATPTVKPTESISVLKPLETRGKAVDIFSDISKAESLNVVVGLDVIIKRGVLDPESEKAEREEIAEAQRRLLSLLADVGHGVTYRYNNVPFLALSLSPEALKVVLDSNEVVSVIEERRAFPTLDDTVTMVEADQAWNTTPTGLDGSGFAIVILDTGVQSNHVFLDGKVVVEACFTDGNCPNGQNKQIGSGSARPCNMVTGCDHGTHVAGIAAGNHTAPIPSEPKAGVAKGADIVAVQVFNPTEGTEPFTMPHLYDRALEEFVLDTLVKGGEIRIGAVNMSFGSGSDANCCNLLSTAALVTKLRDRR